MGITFERHVLSEHAVIGIDGFLGPITKRRYSHKGAWARIIQNQLEHHGYCRSRILDKGDNWNLYDTLILDMGMEYKGTLNLFSGANDALADRLKSMLDYWLEGGRIYTIEGDFPDINELIKSRLNSCSEKFEKLILFAGDWDRMKEKIMRVDKIYESDCVCVGDSHILSMYEPGFEIYRNDGKTLRGMLRKGLLNFIPNKELYHLKVYFGNIDIRHHLMRTNHPRTEVRELVEEYCAQLHEMRFLFKNLTIVAPLPIENESRKLPKTGYYKGTPYYGTRQERDDLRLYMTRLLKDVCLIHDWKLQMWPEWYVNNDGELDMEVMEKPKSVHLSPEYYYYDLFKDSLNTNFHSGTNNVTLFKILK